MKRIAIFTGYYLPHTGGVERYTYNLAKELIKKGNKVFIVTSRYDSNLQEKEETEGITIYRLPTTSLLANFHPILKWNKNKKKLMQELEKENINFVILQTRFWQTTLLGGHFSKKHQIPNFLIEHGVSHFEVKSRVITFFGQIYEHMLTWYVKTLLHGAYGVSKEASKWLNHFHIKAKGILYNSVDTSEYEKYRNLEKKPKDEKNVKIRILFVGRMLVLKGVLELIQAYHQLKEKYELELVLAGDGPLLEKIKEENKDIIFTGNLEHDEIMKLYSSCDIFINPSYTEGLPTTVLEAGLMGIPVVATNVGGTSEIIEDHKSGLLCKPEEKDIKEKLEEMLQNEETRKIYANNLQEKIRKQFSWEQTASKVMKIIEENK